MKDRYETYQFPWKIDSSNARCGFSKSDMNFMFVCEKSTWSALIGSFDIKIFFNEHLDEI